MQIPKSLESVWKEVSRDGSISQNDYNKLLTAAAPNKKDEEFDKSETKFLATLKSHLENSSVSSKGSVPISEIKFDDTPVSITVKDISDVPESLKEAWNKAVSDGKITKSEYEDIKKVAAPNGVDSDLDPKEEEFLSNLRSLLVNTDGELKVGGKNDPSEEQETVPANKDDKTVKSDKVPVKQETEPASSKTKPEQEEVTQPQQAENKKAEVPLEPMPELADIATENDDSLNALNRVQNILNSLGDAKDFEPLKNIVEGRIKAHTTVKGFSSDLKGVMNSIKPGNIESYNEAGAKLDALFNAASDTVKNNPQAKKVYTDAKNYISSQVNKLSNGSKVEKPQIQKENLPFVDDVPEVLKGEWSKASADKKITTEEFDSLVNFAQANNPTEKERDFLLGLRAKFDNGDGTFKESIDLSSKTEESPTKVNTPKKPVLLKWTGYNDENKSALKNSFGKGVFTNKDGMPVLALNNAKKVAEAFGFSSIKEMQTAIKAKPDGQFGPETFFKAKLYAANEVNKTMADIEKLNKMLDSLGNDPEVLKMKESLAGARSEVKPSGESASSDGVPETLRSTWDEITKKGKVTIDDYSKLLNAASPNKRNDEFDDGELGFLNTLNKALSENNGEIKLEGSENKAEEKSNSGIPKTLEKTWNEVTANGKLNLEGYEKLLKAASPSEKDEEFSEDEIAFLKDINAKLKENNGEIILNQTAKVDKPKEEPSKTPSDGIPDSLRSVWNDVTKDGKITIQDYEKILKAASPNKKDEEFSQDEINLLKKLKQALDANNGVVNLKKKS